MTKPKERVTKPKEKVTKQRWCTAHGVFGRRAYPNPSLKGRALSRRWRNRRGRGRYVWWFEQVWTGFVQRLFNGCSMAVQRLFNGCSTVVQWLFNGCSTVVQWLFNGRRIILLESWIGTFWLFVSSSLSLFDSLSLSLFLSLTLWLFLSLTLSLLVSLTLCLFDSLSLNAGFV